MAASDFFAFDDSLWPFLRVELRGMPTDADYTAYLQARTRYLQRRESHLVVIDMLQVRMTTSQQFHQQAEWSARHELLLSERLLGSGFAAASSYMRLGLNVLFYLRPPTAPYVVVPGLSMALAWGVERLETVGLYACAAQVRQRYMLPDPVCAGGRTLV